MHKTASNRWKNRTALKVAYITYSPDKIVIISTDTTRRIINRLQYLITLESDDLCVRHYSLKY
jgi:hypothetical protein